MSSEQQEQSHLRHRPRHHVFLHRVRQRRRQDRGDPQRRRRPRHAVRRLLRGRQERRRGRDRQGVAVHQPRPRDLPRQAEDGESRCQVPRPGRRARHPAGGVRPHSEEARARTPRTTHGQEEAITDVVITCPAYFGSSEKEATRQAGEIAGLNVRSVIPGADGRGHLLRDDRGRVARRDGARVRPRRRHVRRHGHRRQGRRRRGRLRRRRPRPGGAPTGTRTWRRGSPTSSPKSTARSRPS